MYLRRPVITEKNTMLMEIGQYCFAVAKDANKIQIKEAVERTFNVEVMAVNVMNVRGKERRRSGASQPPAKYRLHPVMEESDRHAP